MKYLLYLMFFISCKNAEPERAQVASVNNNLNSETLVPVDLQDSLYGDFRSDMKEFTTKDGWEVNYLVKNDSTRYRDIYIQWKKDCNIRMFSYPYVLLMRSYFLPVFEKETDTHLYFKHGCATGCTAVTALPKSSKLEAESFSFVRDYNIDFGMIVYIPERSYSLETLEIDAFDLNRNCYETVKFKKSCNVLSTPYGCIQKVIFAKNSIELYAEFEDIDGNSIYEKQIIKF